MNGHRLSRYIHRRPLIFLFLLGLLVRLFLLLFIPLPDQTGGDFIFYEQNARALLSTGSFDAEALAPGWSLWIAILYVVFGAHSTVLIGGQLVLGGLLSVGGYMLAALFVSKRTAFFAGIIIAIWPPFVIQTFVWSTSLLLYTTLFLFSLMFFVKAISPTGKWCNAFAAGTFLALAALTDVTALYLPIMLAAWAAVILIRKQRVGEKTAVKKTLLAVFVFLITFSVLVGTWTHRNMIVFDHLQSQDSGNTPQAPLVVKAEEQRIFTEEGVAAIVSVFTPSRLPHFLENAWRTIALPYDLSVLDQYTRLSYKWAVLQYLKGEMLFLTGKELGILTVKALITLLHWVALVVAVLGTAYVIRLRELSLLTFFVASYVIIGISVYEQLSSSGLLDASPLHSFFLPVMSLIVILAATSLVHIIPYFQKD